MSWQQKEQRRDARLYGQWTCWHIQRAREYQKDADDWREMASKVDGETRTFALLRAAQSDGVAEAETRRAGIDAQKAFRQAIKSLDVKHEG